MNQNRMNNVIEALEERNFNRIKDLVQNQHPADIAEIFHLLNTSQAVQFFSIIEDDETKADVLMELDRDERKALLENIPSTSVWDLINCLDSDDAVDLIQELDKQYREEIIRKIKSGESSSISTLLEYDENSAGGLMGTEMVAIKDDASMIDCIKEIRRQAANQDDIYTVFVTDKSGVLCGILPLKNIFINDFNSKIRNIMESEVVSVTVSTTVEDVAILFEKYDLVVLPVIDNVGRLVGQITVDDVMDRIRELSERDYQLASGISSDIDAKDTILSQTKARLPWLLIGIIGGIINSLILGGFEAEIAAVTALALFIPLIGGTGGNVGVQASAIVVQGFANGKLVLKDTGKQIIRCMLIALLNAVVISAVVGIYILFTQTQIYRLAVAAAVGTSLFVVVIFATISGTLVPMTLERLKINPALATGPFIQIMNDVVGLLIYVYMSMCMLDVFGIR